VDYQPDGEPGREWLRDLLSDLSEDGLVTINDGEQATVSLQE
jgi:A/G-specific adenine glycosylase